MKKLRKGKQMKKLMLLAMLAFAAMLLLAPAAFAQAPPTFLVTTTKDLPGTSCGSTCSLRQAINAANANGTSTIGFGVDGIYTLSRGTALHATQAGTPPRPGQTLTINGNGKGKTIIDGGG